MDQPTTKKAMELHGTTIPQNSILFTTCVIQLVCVEMVMTTSVDPGFVYTPYIPTSLNAKNWMTPYTITRTLQDVDAVWHTIKVNDDQLHAWIIDLPCGWRYAANLKFKDKMASDYDLRDDMFSWLIIKWGQ